MAKSKNHTNHTQPEPKGPQEWDHQAKRQRNESTRGMCQKFLHNLRFSKKGNLSREESLKRAEERKAKFAGQPAPVKL